MVLELSRVQICEQRQHHPDKGFIHGHTGTELSESKVSGQGTHYVDRQLVRDVRSELLECNCVGRGRFTPLSVVHLLKEV